MTTEDLEILSSVKIDKLENGRVFMSLDNYKTLLKHAYEDEIRLEDDIKPSREGRIFVGGGLGINNAMIIGGYIF